MEQILSIDSKAIAVLDLNCCFLSFNTAYERFFEQVFWKKISKDSSLLETLKEFSTVEGRVKKLWEECIFEENFQGIQIKINSSLEMQFSPLCDVRGEMTAVSHTIATATDKKNTKLTNYSIFQSVINNTQDLIAALDLDFNFIAFNKSYGDDFKRVFGKELLIGMNLKELLRLHVNVWEKVSSLWRRAMFGESYNVEEEIGESLYDLRFSPLLDENGEIAGASHIATNITNRMLMQKTIKELNEQLSRKLQLANENVIESNHNINKLQHKVELVLDTMGTGIWTWNINKNVVRADKRSLALYQLPSSENITAEDFFTKIHKDDAENARKEFQRCASEKTYLMSIEYRIVYEDGSSHWIASKGKKFFDESGETEEIVVLTWDITHKITLQKEREEALRVQQEKTEYFEKLAESVDLIVYILNSKGELEYCNQKYTEYTGFKWEDIRKWDLTEILHKSDAEDFRRRWSEALRLGNKFVAEYRLRCSSDNMYRWHIGKISPLYNSEGKIVKWFGTGTDIHDLKKTQERLDIILKTANIGLWDWDLDTGRTEIDDRTMELFGIDKNTYTNKVEEVFVNINPADVPAIHASVEICKKGEGPYDSEFRILTKDGSIRYIGGRGEAQFDDKGNAIKLMGINLDITKRKELELKHMETLKQEYEHKEFLNILLERVSLGVWTCDTNGDVDYVNQYWSEKTGITAPMKREDNYQTFYNILRPEDREETSKRFLHSFETGTKFQMEYQISVNGSYRWFSAQATPLMDSDGKPIRWLGTCVDIHDLKETIKELEFQINLTKTITDNTASALFMIDERGYPTFMNPAAERITGYTLEEIKSTPFQKLMTEGRENFEAPNWEVEVKEVQNEGELFVDKSGRRYPVIRSTSRLSRNGKTIGTVVEFRDVTLEKQAEQEKLEALRKAELLQKKRAEEAENNKKRQEEFINTICHEVRNPLNGLIGITALLNDELKDIQDNTMSSIYSLLEPFHINRFTTFFFRVSEYIKTLEVCSEQQKVIVDDVLDLSKLENNKISLHYSSFNLKVLINNSLQMFLGKITEKRLKYKVNIPSLDVFICGDMYRLSQIIVNLLSNAIKFTDLGGITIDVVVHDISSSELNLSISISDTGIGMSPDEVINLFNSFYQVSIKNSYGGSGLGLVITKKLVELMGGKITVTSEKWKGSKFNVTLNCKKANQMDKIETSNFSKDISQNSQGKLILIVEDNLINQKVLSNYLEKKGYNYHIANNGVEALEKCKIYNFDLILMDIEMPLMNGLEATTKIRIDSMNSNYNTPIIGLSGNSMKQQIDEAIATGMNDYLTKPYHKEDVYKIIDKYL